MTDTDIAPEDAVFNDKPLATVSINQTELPVLEHDRQRVITLSMMDEVHSRVSGTARKRFNDHKERLVLGEDYFVRNTDEARELGFTAPNGLILLTETGYLMLVKSFSDDLAWDVQRRLVNGYFRVQANNVHFLVPQTLPEALRLAADLAEKKAELEAEVARLEPKADFHDRVTEAVNSQTVEEVAKIAGTGRNRFYAFMRRVSICQTGGDKHNIPYQRYIDQGYFRLVERQYNDKRGESHTYSYPLVTGKGFTYLMRRWAEDGQVAS